MNARCPASDPEFQVVAAIPPDEWDRWNDDRDRYLTRSRSYQYVSPDVYGAEDLDQYGQWVNDPSYGYVWQPAVAPGWAPYQAGRWVWEDFYGWTWVSYDPWGWAPYHYGRWFWGAAGWCWYPGPIYAHPFWAPAYVGFFGWGGGFGAGVGFGFGNIGWVALAPFEAFHPWWGRGFYGGYRSGVFVNNTTVVNNINVTNVYRNARVNGGITGVAAGSFGRGTQFNSFNGSQIQQASLVHGVLPVSPDRSSLRLSDRPVSGNLPQARTQNFASRMQAPRVDHVGFEQQQRGMQQYSRSNFGGNTPTSSGGGWRQVGDRPGSVAGSAAASHGWSRFGEPIHGTTPAPQLERNTQPGGSNNAFGSNRSAWGGGAQPLRMSPPIVSQRAPAYNASPNYQAPRNATPIYQAPHNSGGGNAGHSGGGSGHSGGGHSGGGHGGHR